MPVDSILRSKILQWIKEGKTYETIKELVKKEGGKISNGGITYIKKEEAKKITEQKTEETTEQTEQGKKEDQTIKKNRKHIEEVKKDLLQPVLEIKILSDLEFSLLKSSYEIVFKSNQKRLKNNNASGILNSLNNVRNIIKIIEKRGNYQ